MKFTALLKVCATLSLLSSGTLISPASAQPLLPEYLFPEESSVEESTIEPPVLVKPPKPQTVKQTQIQTIPKSTAIVVTFPNLVEIDVGQNQEYSEAVPLAQPILDKQGNIAIPANTPVTVKLIPSGGDAKLIAESLIVNGKVIPIKASGSKISGQKFKLKAGTQKAGENSPTYTRLGSTIFETFGGETPENQERGAVIGQGVGIIVDLMSPETLQIVTIPAGSSHVLTLESSIVLETK